MKILFAIIVSLLLSHSVAFSQVLQCSCTLDSSINSSTTSCKTTVLKNKAKLYYQFNCDSVWLTLENPNGKKKIVYSMSGVIFKDLFGYNFRLGYQLAHEYEKYLLFRTGCPANGPCNFVLVNKTTGKVGKQLGELIYDHTESKFYDFVLYFSNANRKSLTIYYPDSGKQFLIPLNDYNYFTAVVPEYMFNAVTVTKKRLTLTYGKKKITINLNKYHS